MASLFRRISQLSFPEMVRSNAIKLPLMYLMLQIAGCSSSGGESLASGSPPPIDNSPPEYHGSTSWALVNKDNALVAASRLVEARDLIQLVEGLWIDAPSPKDAPAEPITESIEDGLGGSVTLTAVLVANEYRVTVVFDEFVEEGITASGILSQRILDRNIGPDDRIFSKVAGTLEVQRLRLTSREFDFELSGILQSLSPSSDVLLANILAKDMATGASGMLQDFRLELAVNQVYPNSLPVFTKMSGAIYDSLEGRLDIETVEPLFDFDLKTHSGLDSDLLWTGTHSGLVRFRGSEEFLLASLSGRYAALVFDENADGTYEMGKRVTWRALNDLEELPTVGNGVAPIANTGGTWGRRVGMTTSLHGLFSHDDDNNYLRHQWKLVYAPNQSRAPQQVEDAFLTFVPDIAGDYVYELTVDDGEHQSNTRMSFRVGEQPDSKVDKTRFLMEPNIEITPLSDDGSRFIVDFGSRLTSPEAEASSSDWQIFSRGLSTDVTLTTNADGLTAIVESETPIAGAYDIHALLGSTSHSTIATVDIGVWQSTRIDPPLFDLKSVYVADLNLDQANDLLVISKGLYQAVEIWMAKEDGGYLPERYEPADYIESLHVAELREGEPAKIILQEGTEIRIHDGASFGQAGAGHALQQFDHGCGIGYYPARNIGTGDYDGDGLQDLLAIHPCLPYLIVWQQAHNGSFVAPVQLALGDRTIEFAQFGDVNHDGRVDLAISGASAFKVMINMKDSFVSASGPLGVSQGLAGFLVDIDSDGRLDVANFEASVEASALDLVLFRYSGNGAFDRVSTVSGLLRSGLSALGTTADLNGDSRADLVFTLGEHLYVALRLDNGYAVSQLSLAVSTRDPPASVGVMDFNHDGYLDVLAPLDTFAIFLGGRAKPAAPRSLTGGG